MWTWRFVGLLILGIAALITAITSVTMAAISLTQQVHTAQYVDTMSKNVSLTLATQEAIERKLEMRVDALLLLLLSRFSRVWLCATPLTEAHQAPPSLGFSRQEHWSGLPFPSPMMKVKSEREVAQLCPTLSNPLDEAIIHIGTELQALKVKMALSCHTDYRWICVTPLKVNETDFDWEKNKNRISGA